MSLWSRNGFCETHPGALLMCTDDNLSLRRNLPKVTWKEGFIARCGQACPPPNRLAESNLMSSWPLMSLWGYFASLNSNQQQYIAAPSKKKSLILGVIFQSRCSLGGLPWWLSGKESTYQYRTVGFHPWVRKVPWRRKWQPIRVLLPGKSHGPRSLVGCSQMVPKELDTT